MRPRGRRPPEAPDDGDGSADGSDDGSFPRRGRAPQEGDSVGDVWGAPPSRPSAPGAPHPFDLGLVDRYEQGSLHGVGGMGRVFAMHDRLLRREVARKSVTGEAGPTGSERLAREAFITAQLEHPGIVAIYDAGLGPDGVPWYTMRLVRGQTLSAMLRGPASIDRFALLRPLLAATHAVAYAHSRGFIHRDLKPDNILIGEFGETQVADWGLATAADGRDPFASSDGATAPHPDPMTSTGATSAGAIPTGATPAGAASTDATPAAASWGDTTSVGVTIGTPAYMSPEQVRGERATKRSDVWSLGATLREVLTGVPPFTGGEGGTLALRRAAGGGGWAATEVPGEPEFTAILARAQAADPMDRYADAGSLADDLARFLDGRRVLAHRYSARDLALRLLRLWRAPLAVAALASVLLAGVGALAWQRTQGERALAIASEEAAVGARALAETHLSEALVAQARTAERAGQRARAETLALAALGAGELPAARGVLVAVDRGPRPERLGVTPDRTCDAIVPESDGAPWLCVVGSRVVASTTDGAIAWERSFPAPPLLAAGRRGERFLWWQAGGLQRLDASDGSTTELRALDSVLHPQWVTPAPEGPWLLIGRADAWVVRDREARTEQEVHPCGVGTVALAPIWEGDELLLLCSDGQLARGRRLDDRIEFVQQQLPSSLGPGAARLATWGVDGLLLTTDFGHVALLDRTTLAVREAAQLTDHPLVAIATDIEQGVAVLRGDRGDVIVWRPGSPSSTTLPSRASAMIFNAGGDLLLYGARRERWRLPLRPAPDRVEVGVGLTDLELRPDGLEAVGTRGDGSISIWSLGDGVVRERSLIRGVVLKDATFTADGKALLVAAATISGPGLHWLDASYEARWTRSESPARRVAALADGRALRLDWSTDGPDLIDPLDGAPSKVGWPGTFFDLAVSADRRRVVLAREGGQVVRATLRDGELVRDAELAVSDLRRLAVANDGGVFAAVERAVSVFSAEGELERVLEAPMDVCTSLAASPSGGLIAAGDLAGGIFVWDRRSGALLAELRAHASRVSSLTFGFDDVLLSASWDGTMRRWSLRSLTREVAELRRDLGPWALTMEEALAQRR